MSLKITLFITGLSAQYNSSEWNSPKLGSAAWFCHQVAAWVPDMFCNFYLVKSHKIANISATTEGTEKNKHIFGILKNRNFLNVCFTKFENYQILLNKISHRFLVTTKLFSGWKNLIKNSVSSLAPIIFECGINDWEYGTTSVCKNA